MRLVRKFVVTVLGYWSILPSLYAAMPQNHDYQIHEIIHDGDQFLGVVVENSIHENLCQSLIIASKDGMNWKQNSEEFPVCLHGVAYGNNTSIAVGNEEKDELNKANLVLRSKNHGDWAELPVPKEVQQIADIAYGNGLFVMVNESDNEKSSQVFLSDDQGDNWLAISLEQHWNSPKISFSNHIFFLYGDGPYIATSSDGKNWEIAEWWVNFVTYFGWHLGTYYGSGVWKYGVENEPVEMYLSKEGYRGHGSGMHTGYIRNIVSFDNYSIAIKSDGILKYNDPIFSYLVDWEEIVSFPADSQLSSLAYHEGITVVGGKQAIFVSTDGKNFEPANIHLTK